jgi:hypothetical protein
MVKLDGESHWLTARLHARATHLIDELTIPEDNDE